MDFVSHPLIIIAVIDTFGEQSPDSLCRQLWISRYPSIGSAVNIRFLQGASTDR